MYIHRDIETQFKNNTNWIQVLIGPRQCGKSTLFTYLSGDKYQELTFDDLALRRLANESPALFLEQFNKSLVLDEVQYVPALFPELKKKVDQIKKDLLFNKTHREQEVLYRLTGSNQILMDKSIKESLAGRASYFFLNTLTVNEIKKSLPDITINEILFKGGWPELYTNTHLSSIQYINDYIRTYVEKDIVLNEGIQKIGAFHTILNMAAARVGQLLDYSSIGNDGGVSSPTVKEWLSLLERADLIYLLKPFFTNLNKRLIKAPKLYFWDTGLAVRLQGWSEITPLISSPQMGALFENLVFAEIIKFIRNYQKDWELYFWRTKEGEEIDFLLQTTHNEFLAIEVKLSIENQPRNLDYPSSFKKLFNPTKPLIIVTYGGQTLKLSENCVSIPIAELHDYLFTL
jgi:predicted AAA+ superfamily ATPase